MQDNPYKGLEDSESGIEFYVDFGSSELNLMFAEVYESLPNAHYAVVKISNIDDLEEFIKVPKLELPKFFDLLKDKKLTYESYNAMLRKYPKSIIHY